MERLRLIGYWSGPQTSEGWPDPRSFVDEDWDEDERSTVSLYLLHGVATRAYMGLSRCRFCDALVGSLELSDGTYVWPEGLSHYVEEHGVRLPAEFVDHVQASEEALDGVEYDVDWWRRQGSPEST